MKRMCVLFLALMLTVASGATTLATGEPARPTLVPATLVPSKPAPATPTPDPSPTPMATPQPEAALAPEATPASGDASDLQWATPTPEQQAAILAVYERFLALCRERGEIISDTAFATNPDAAAFAVVYRPMEGLVFTAVPEANAYYLNTMDLTGIGWARHRALWADMVRAIDSTIDADKAVRLINSVWDELEEPHPGIGGKEGRVEENGWSYTALTSPEDGAETKSMLMVGPILAPAEGMSFLSQPLVVDLVMPGPENDIATRRRAMFRTQMQDLGMTLLPDDLPTEAEYGGLIYAGYLVTDTVEWTDLFNLEDGSIVGHYALHKEQIISKEDISDLSRSVLAAAIAAAGDFDAERSTQLLGTLVDGLAAAEDGSRLESTIDNADGRVLSLRADPAQATWFILVSWM